MIHHHPDDALLLARAAGNLASGPSLVVGSHVESCGQCRNRARFLEAVGGTMLEDLETAALPAGALARALAAIDTPVEANLQRASTVAGHPELPVGLAWPRALRSCKATGWRWLAPGVRFSRITLPYDKGANIFLLRVAAGRQLPQHSHGGSEVTQVLYGSFNDGRGSFGPGDFDETDGSVDHRPVVPAAGECICLASLEGKLLFQGVLARTLGALAGL